MALHCQDGRDGRRRFIALLFVGVRLAALQRAGVPEEAVERGHLGTYAHSGSAGRGWTSTLGCDAGLLEARKTLRGIARAAAYRGSTVLAQCSRDRRARREADESANRLAGRPLGRCQTRRSREIPGLGSRTMVAAIRNPLCRRTNVTARIPEFRQSMSGLPFIGLRPRGRRPGPLPWAIL